MRRIVTAELQAAGTPAAQDNYADRVIKYIPSDIVAAWVAILGLLANAVNVPRTATLWVLFVVMVLITAWWTYKNTAVPGKPAATTQILLSTGSFIVWVFALPGGGPFASLGFYEPLYGSLLVIIYSLVVGLVVPKEG